MPKGLRRSLSRGAPSARDSIALRAVLNDTLTVDGASGVGFGSIPIAGLPEGHLLILGARADLTFSEAVAGITDTWSGDFSVGTTPVDDGTIGGADADIIASTAVGPASAGAASAAAENVTTATIDNSAGTGEVNLNLLIDDANISADDQDVTVTGYVTLVYAVLGD